MTRETGRLHVHDVLAVKERTILLGLLVTCLLLIHDAAMAADVLGSRLPSPDQSVAAHEPRHGDAEHATAPDEPAPETTPHCGYWTCASLDPCDTIRAAVSAVGLTALPSSLIVGAVSQLLCDLNDSDSPDLQSPTPLLSPGSRRAMLQVYLN